MADSVTFWRLLMLLTIIYFPMIEKIVLTTDDPTGFLQHSADDMAKIVRQEDVDDQALFTIQQHWKYVHSHGDFYTATPNMIMWLDTPNLELLPTFDSPFKDREIPILITECRKHPLIAKSASAIRSYIGNGVRNKKTGKIIRLEYVDLPEGRAITVEGYRRFIDRLNESVENAATHLE